MAAFDKIIEDDRVIYVFTAHQPHHGLRLDSFIKSFMGNMSRQIIKRKIAKQEIFITNRPTANRPSTTVYQADQVRMILLRDRRALELEYDYWQGVPLDIDLKPAIIEESAGLLIISKPPFMTTHPTGRHFFNCATTFFEQQYKHTIHSIHRLDRETSGILLLGKNPATSRDFTALFEQHLVRKCYFLIARKSAEFKNKFPFTACERMSEADGAWKDISMQAFAPDSDQGKEAMTQFHLLEEQEDSLIALAFPLTGRQHQIRLHAAIHGFPLVGDKIYNGDREIFIRYKDGVATDADFKRLELPRHALHACALNYPNPIVRKTVIDHIPHDLQAWLAKHNYSGDQKLFEMISRVCAQVWLA